MASHGEEALSGQAAESTTRNEPRPGDYIQWKTLPPGGPLNRWSQALTRGHDFPGAQAMLFAAGVPNMDMMKNAPQVGVATVWWEGNPCK